MPKKAGTVQWRKQRRKEYLEKKEYRYYIFCEGEQTEPLYFEGFKRLIEDNPIYKDMVLIELESCAAETMRVIGMSERIIEENKGKMPADIAPGTKVYELVEELARYLSEDMTDHFL